MVFASTVTGNGTTGGVPTSLDFIGPTINVTVAGQSQKVFAIASKALGSNMAGGAKSLTLFMCYRSASTGSIGTIGSAMLGLSVGQSQRIPFSLNAVVSGLQAGTYAFGLCGYAGVEAANWNSNEFGYVSAMVLN